MVEKTHPILNALIPVANGIQQTLGDTCEVAIHDLHRPRHSIFYITHGEVTGRKIGDSLGPMFDDLSQLASMDSDSLINYYSFMNGHALRCSKILIRDEEGNIIGCLCINIVLDDYLKAKHVIDKMCETSILDSSRKPVGLEVSKGDEISGLVSDIITNTYKETIMAKGSLSPQDKIDITKFLDERGVFKVRGTVDYVAELLGVSKNSVYSYIDKIRSGQQ